MLGGERTPSLELFLTELFGEVMNDLCYISSNFFFLAFKTLICLLLI